MSFLINLKQTAVPGHNPEMGALPPVLPGQGIKTGILATLRRQQLADIIRAYRWEKLCSPDLPANQMLDFLQLQEVQGAFERPPERPYYFMRARYTADQVRDSKFGKAVNGMAVPRGWMFDPATQRLVPCEALQPWHGPDPDPAPPKPTMEEVREHKRQVQSENASKSVIAQLRVRAKELGVNSFGLGRDALAIKIAEAEGKIAKPETES